MDAAGIYARLSEKFSGAFEPLNSDGPDPFAEVKADNLAEVARFCKDDAELAFDFLESISGVDTTEVMFCVYHLFSYEHRHSFVLKVRVPYDSTDIPTVSDVWPAANWHEREQYDLFGFNFTGHPDLRRILLPEDWAGHPLRKTYEYPDEYHGIDHYRPDPKEQFKALDDLAAKAAAKVKEQKAKAEAAS